jgi:hypothetical protein
MRDPAANRLGQDQRRVPPVGLGVDRVQRRRGRRVVPGAAQPRAIHHLHRHDRLVRLCGDGRLRRGLGARPQGRIPYTIFPPDPSHTVYQPISYSAESFIDVDLRYPEALPLVSPLKTTCDWLASNQTKDGAFRGSWGSFTSTEQGRFGFSASGDAQRSPRALSLLQWCSLRLSPPTPAHAAAAEAFVEFVQRPDAASAFGINALVLPTGFVGLALADYVQPWSTFRSRRSH